MSKDDKKQSIQPTRREFLATSGAVAGAAALGMDPGIANAAKRHPKRGGTVRFATRSDARGLDPHRNILYYVSSPLAATTAGLLDFDENMNLKPGLAESYDISKDLKTYTFKLRKGAEYHNGQTIDADSIKWNIERIKDPKIGHAFTRSAITDVERVTVDDKYTVQIHLKNPSAIFAANVMYYPINMMAPGGADTADTNPQGCGPFKFKSWKRFDTTEMVRFENFWETDADGNALPYLDGVIGKPKKEDRVRLTALRTGEVDLIDNMAYADMGDFKKNYSNDFNTWEVSQVGTGYVSFNLKNGPFSPKDNPNAHMLRLAAAHAIDHEGIHQAIFHGQGSIAESFYYKSSPWHSSNVKPWPEYDLDKAKSLLKKAGGSDVKILLVARDAYPYMHQTGEIVHSMLQEAGFNISFEIHPNPVLRAKYKKGDFNMDSSANSYRMDPDAWYARAFHSQSPTNKTRYGYENEKVDQLITAAKVELDNDKRRQMYADIDSIINTDVPLIYTHYIPLLEAGTKKLKGYKPAFPGPFQYTQGGLRTSWIDTTT